MTSRRTTVALMLTLLTTGCATDPPDKTYRSLNDFSALHLSKHSVITTESLPSAPSGFTDRDVRTLAETLVDFAERGTYDPDVWHPSSQRAAIDLVLSSLDHEERRTLDQDADDQLSGRPWANLVASVFADDVRVVGRPVMRRATWDVRREDESGVAWLEIRVQTRTFFEVRHHGRPSVVVATHTWELSSPGPVGDYYRSVVLGSDALGADACAFIVRSVITPDQDQARYLKAMKAEVLGASPTKFIEPTGDQGDATAKACRDD